MSAGIGGVPAAQTYLDITQGNRVSESLYDDELPSIGFDRAGVEAADWEVIAQRAADAPAELVPGLLTTALDEAGLSSAAERAVGLGRLAAADRDGRIEPAPGGGCTWRLSGPERRGGDDRRARRGWRPGWRARTC